MTLKRKFIDYLKEELTPQQYYDKYGKVPKGYHTVKSTVNKVEKSNVVNYAKNLGRKVSKSIKDATSDYLDRKVPGLKKTKKVIKYFKNVSHKKIKSGDVK